MTVPISVMIPTRNEEKNIGKCLKSVSWADEIYVVDSCSTDRTAEIASNQGATVVSFAWDGQGPRKKSWAISNLPWKHEWLLVVDADEEATPSLQEEIAALVSRPSRYAGFLLTYHFYFLGRLIKHGAPLRKLVLFKHSLTQFEQVHVPEVTAYDVELHEHPLVRGPVGRLNSPMIHNDFDEVPPSEVRWRSAAAAVRLPARTAALHEAFVPKSPPEAVDLLVLLLRASRWLPRRSSGVHLQRP